jgi:peptidyl-prolyl cis-trans isomerase SurA
MIPTARMRALVSAVFGVCCVATVAVAETELNRVVATVDGDPITAHELDRYVVDMGTPDVPREQLLETLITERLLEREAEERKVTVTDDDVTAYVTEVRKQNGLDEAGFAAALEAQGLTIDAYRARLKDELLKTQLVNQEIRSRVNVPHEEVERYYDAHKETYRTSGGRTVRDIFLPVPPGASDAEVSAVEAKARELASQATSKRKFASLAREHSKGPGAEQGGVLGTFGPGEMQDEFDSVVFSLKVGEVSAPIAAGGGYHVLRVDDEVDAGYRSIDDVEDQIREELYGQALEERYREWLTHDLREKHDVEVLN